MNRVANLDGSLHYTGDCCQSFKCDKCGAPEHVQGIYGGIIYLCERCDADSRYWEPADKYCPLCECVRTFCTCHEGP